MNQNTVGDQEIQDRWPLAIKPAELNMHSTLEL